MNMTVHDGGGTETVILFLSRTVNPSLVGRMRLDR